MAKKPVKKREKIVKTKPASRRSLLKKKLEKYGVSDRAYHEENISLPMPIDKLIKMLEKIRDKYPKTKVRGRWSPNAEIQVRVNQRLSVEEMEKKLSKLQEKEKEKAQKEKKKIEAKMKKLQDQFKDRRPF